ncbi:bestrophin 4 [Phyllostomus discolor]|uniref:Bestrophin n=1 Tax=Phyllostomus discolor TaxID=89673 RepID=A0A834A2R4_9CHIR|nr:bestrophin 4 [Phyllostomus discolor]
MANCWWAQYTNIPLPDQLMGIISATVHSLDQRGCQPCHTLVCCEDPASALLLRSVSIRVLQSLPTTECVVGAGSLSQKAREKFESLKSDFNKYWVPQVWLTNLAAQTQRDGRIHDGTTLCLLLGQKLPPAKKDLYREGGCRCRQLPPYNLEAVAQSVRPSFLGSTFSLR